MDNYSVKIQGTIAGDIWWPQVLCWKYFDYKVQNDETLREAILHITNDGDFQSCNIVDATIVATIYKRNKKIVRYFDLRSPLFPSVADCLLDENNKDYETVVFASCEE